MQIVKFFVKEPQRDGKVVVFDNLKDNLLWNKIKEYIGGNIRMIRIPSRDDNDIFMYTDENDIGKQHPFNFRNQASNPFSSAQSFCSTIVIAKSSTDELGNIHYLDLNKGDICMCRKLTACH